MKKNKIIGAIVALGGILVSFGTAFALFQKTAAPLTVNIGPYTWQGSSGDITHTISEPVVTSNRGSVSITPNGYTYSGDVLMNETAQFKLGGSYAAATNIQHDIIAGKVTVTITIASELVNKVDAAVYMNGYTANSEGARLFADTNLTGTGGNVTLDATTKTYTRDVVVQNNQTQSVNVYLDFSAVYTSSYMPLAESATAYSVHVAWEGVDESSWLHNTKLPVVRGDYNNWEVGPEYAMLPDISKSDAEQTKTRFIGHVGGLSASALTGQTYFSEFKVFFQSEANEALAWKGDNGNNKTNDGSHSVVYIDDGDAYYL